MSQRRWIVSLHLSEDGDVSGWVTHANTAEEALQKWYRMKGLELSAEECGRIIAMALCVWGLVEPERRDT